MKYIFEGVLVAAVIMLLGYNFSLQSAEEIIQDTKYQLDRNERNIDDLLERVSKVEKDVKEYDGMIRSTIRNQESLLKVMRSLNASYDELNALNQ